ncbi:heptaprenyl diphosphate synthase component 1 [Thermoflavimicrobium dichotomicum]|uniref:Heptaprenyl diphosphate synthase n=1 Tax=Thermoflavimicrobium dichotomicum TaxID=46223 RepID=A0A1I3SGJ6_9BACL|nr:heptaprenyl diphosphate synthase component 1 [Thermoflavimicrobium dichotomicum]SFJ57894.1 heptaprenyl diphosphate synthase [Thermoflavimicrobium dichotomicum]
MTSIHTEIDKSFQRIRELAHEPYLEKVIGKPKIPVFFVQLLHLFMESYGVPKERAHVYCVATTLLKMGLDLHEKVSLDHEEDLQKTRARQLYVLAGDYFSSLYYHLLSRYQEIEGIKCLARATSTINEAKMVRYHTADHEAKWEKRQVIESGLLTALADFFHVVEDLRNLWHRLLSSLTVLHLLEEDQTDWNETLFQKCQSAWHEAKKAVSQLPTGEVKGILTEKLDHWSKKLGSFSLVKGG